MMTTMVNRGAVGHQSFSLARHLVGRTIRLTSPMLFALGFVSNFVIGA